MSWAYTIESDQLPAQSKHILISTRLPILERHTAARATSDAIAINALHTKIKVDTCKHYEAGLVGTASPPNLPDWPGRDSWCSELMVQ
eukprot:455274-Pelagomonas_calceolata.AAC.2